MALSVFPEIIVEQIEEKDASAIVVAPEHSSFAGGWAIELIDTKPAIKMKTIEISLFEIMILKTDC